MCTANVYKLGNIYFASRFSAASFQKAIIMINSHKFVTSNGELMYIHTHLLMAAVRLQLSMDGVETEKWSALVYGLVGGMASRVIV